jgi:hypothetical protein
MKRGNGFGLVGLILVMLILGLMSMQYFRAPGTAGGKAELAPIDGIEKAREVACRMNIMRITQQLQIYSLNQGEPMKELDLVRLFRPQTPPEPPKGSSCTYRFDDNGAVVCTVHR